MIAVVDEHIAELKAKCNHVKITHTTLRDSLLTRQIKVVF
jgi:hypothetical protein